MSSGGRLLSLEAPKREPDPDMVERCRHLLAAAEAGEIDVLTFAYVRNGLPGYGTAAVDPCGVDRLVTQLGALDLARQSLSQRITTVLEDE